MTILVYEHVTGGGLAGRALPASWAAEGSAMRRAIAADFAAVPGVRVVVTLDPRFAADPLPGVECRNIDPSGLGSLAASADHTVLIAPEAEGLLEALAGEVEAAGGRLLGPGREAVALVADKLGLAHLLTANGVPTPPTCALGPSPSDFPSDWPGPLVVKPRRGAGALDTFVVPGRRSPAGMPLDRSFVVQPYLSGEPRSGTFLIDRDGLPTLLAVGLQRIQVDGAGRISYQGGTILGGDEAAPPAVWKALGVVGRSVPGGSLRGFVGVDYLVDDRGRATVLEVNPRPTTSYVGLAKFWPPGTVAGAWLAACEGPLAGTDWPDRLRLTRAARPVRFDADGTIRDEPGDPRR